MEKLPQSALKRLQGVLPEAESHPGPDLLTAFAEHCLPKRERSRVVDHLATCRDCRDILAIAAAAESPTQLGILPPARHSPRPWFAWPAYRWAALAAGVLVVASVGILQYAHHRQNLQVASNSLPNEASVSAPSNPLNTATNEKDLQNAASDAHNISAAAQTTGLHQAPKPGFTGGRENESAPRPSAQPHAPREKLAAAPPNPPTDEVQSRAGKNVFADAAEPETQLAQNPSAPLLPGQNDNIDVVKAKNPVSGQAAPTATVLGALPQQSLLPVSPGNFRWAINAGALQRSDDGGRTWQNVNPAAGSAPEFLAIAVNGLEVWVGGSARSLYHSTGAGTHWTRITPSANGASLTGNVIGIEFPDPLHGKISTSTAELWTTSDGGQTWQRQR